MSCSNKKNELFSSPACQIHQNCGDVVSISIGPATIRINHEMLIHLATAIDVAISKTEMAEINGEDVSLKKRFKLIH